MVVDEIRHHLEPVPEKYDRDPERIKSLVSKLYAKKMDNVESFLVTQEKEAEKKQVQEQERLDALSAADPEQEVTSFIKNVVGPTTGGMNIDEKESSTEPSSDFVSSLTAAVMKKLLGTNEFSEKSLPPWEQRQQQSHQDNKPRHGTSGCNAPDDCRAIGVLHRHEQSGDQSQCDAGDRQPDRREQQNTDWGA